MLHVLEAKLFSGGGATLVGGATGVAAVSHDEGVFAHFGELLGQCVLVAEGHSAGNVAALGEGISAVHVDDGNLAGFDRFLEVSDGDVRVFAGLYVHREDHGNECNEVFHSLIYSVWILSPGRPRPLG